MTAPPLSCEGVFDRWLHKRSSDAYDPLTPSAARPYRSMWVSWCGFLCDPLLGVDPKSWEAATSEDVVRFLYSGGIRPSGSRRSTPSDITRQRYFRVLDSIYEFARNAGAAESNPLDDVMTEDLPRLKQSEGQIFHQLHWLAITNSIPKGHELLEVRNRALVSLIMDSAMSTAEVAELRTNSITALENGLALQVTGPRKSQHRVVFTGSMASRDISAWIRIRATLPPLKRGPQDALFTTQKSGPLRTTGVYHIVNQTIQRALAEEAPLHMHTGAQMLRNTRIVQWLNQGHPPHEVAARVGLKDTKSFRGLRRHITVGLKLTNPQRSTAFLDRANF